MSQVLINRYLSELDRLRRVSGANRESVVREAFKDLLKAWGRTLDLQFVAEHEYITPAKDRRYIDGALLHSLRVPFGYWEAKDSADDLDEEIARKFRRGYPQTNIVFEDSTKAVLIQGGQEVARCSVDDVAGLERLLDLFFGYQRPEIADFRKTIAQFKTDLPAVLTTLRGRIEHAYKTDPPFSDAAREFLREARKSINPTVTDAVVREMLIQHILTEDIFARVFGQGDFHRENNVAKALYGLERLFFHGGVKQQTLRQLEPYYAAIRSTAALIESHSEKQGFLKAIYENFYKVYNPKSADRLGVIYTPNEIVRFMVEGADWLCQTHFGKNLIDRDVEILDPATGTGTFIVELLQHFRGRPADLKYKYLNELHANEVAILPYYVANLNIEATYAAITGEYTEFPNLCFMDTLDNTTALKTQKGQHYGDLLGGISAENADRIKRQNECKIRVIIGNPPYNANQRSENDNNKNREYPEIDRRIKASYIAESSAQKTKNYDMYVRFLCWASDRIDEDGIVCFITNRSFIDARNLDGFRKAAPREFAEVLVVDLGGDYKKKGVAGGGNVFGIGTGVAISFWIKRRNKDRLECKISYAYSSEVSGDDKLAWLGNSDLNKLGWSPVVPRDGYWVDHPSVPWRDAIPLIGKGTKSTKIHDQEQAIFKLFTLGVSTNRDEWLYDRDRKSLAAKMRNFISVYNGLTPGTAEFPDSIKWSRNLKRHLTNGKRERFSGRRIVETTYRPFTRRYLYYSPVFTDELGLTDEIFLLGKINRAICFTDPTAQKPWFACALDGIADLHFVGAGAGAICIPVYSYKGGIESENVTDWALLKFRNRYGDMPALAKDDIFAYVYAVLHDPRYRATYAENLRRDFPHIPFHTDFARWRDWGKSLLDLHIGYDQVDPYPLTRIDSTDRAAAAAGQAPRPILKSGPADGTILLDTETHLSGVPASAWRYVLGNRCAIDWVLDQHKEKRLKDPTIRDRFNTYRFADYKEPAIDLLRRLVTVSADTVAITDAMAALPR